MPRTLSFTDRIICNLDRGLRTVLGSTLAPSRPNPAEACAEDDLSAFERRTAIGLMRVNHAGEVSAQALYQGQALTARDPRVREALEYAVEEENDHLYWCRERLHELGGHTSAMDPLWYAGAFAIGALAGLIGDRASLGFLAETERQVVDHLNGHLERLPCNDARSRAILEQMKSDEAGHATTAVEQGAAELPEPVKTAMRLSSKVMTRTASWI